MKFAIPGYVLYLDTNCLYSRKPSEVVSKGVAAALEELRGITHISANVAEVSVDELAYQQFSLAVAASDNLLKNLNTINQAVGIQLGECPTQDVIRKCALDKVRNALNSCDIGVCNLDISKVQWGSLIGDSCWRDCVFERPPEDSPRWEKGFRDRVILETIAQHADEGTNTRNAVITGDKLLQSSLEKVAKKLNLKFQFFASLGDLISLLRVEEKSKLEGFANALLASISGFFYDPESSDCLFYKAQIKEIIEERFLGSARDPGNPMNLRPQGSLSLGPQTLGSAFASLNDKTLWNENPNRQYQAKGPTKVRVKSTHIQNNKVSEEYYWSTKIDLVTMLVSTPSSYMNAQQNVIRHLKIVSLEVQWSCDVDSVSAAISNAKFLNISQIGLPLLVVADFASCLRYGISFAHALFDFGSDEGMELIVMS